MSAPGLGALASGLGLSNAAAATSQAYGRQTTDTRTGEISFGPAADGGLSSSAGLPDWLLVVVGGVVLWSVIRR